MKLFLKSFLIVVVMAFLAACGGSDFEWFPEANKSPVANAGTNQSVDVGAVVTLDGSASKDENDDKLTYSWAITTKPSGSTATLSSATAVNPTFTADLTGDYVCSLTVNDGTVSSTATAVTVTASVGNAPPVAKITVTSNTVAIGSSVSVSGSGSTDANSDPLTYRWALTVPTGSITAKLSSATAVNPNFTPDLPGAYILTLTVNDGKADSATPATATITASTLPVANAGLDQTVFAGDTVKLDGSASTAPNGGTISTYTWTFTPPTTGDPILDTIVPAKPTFTTSVAGTYVISLIVNDGKANSVADSVTVTVKPLVAPVAIAGPDKSAFVDVPVILDGKASTDSRGVADVNGDKLNYYWSKISGSCGNSSSFNGATLTVTTPNVGTCEFGLQVSDKSLGATATLSSVDKVLINVTQGTGSITVTW